MIKWQSLKRRQFRYWKKWYCKKYLWNKSSNSIAQILYLIFLAYYTYRVTSGLDTGILRSSNVTRSNLFYYRKYFQPIFDPLINTLLITGFIIDLSICIYFGFKSGKIRYLIEYVRCKSIIKKTACYCDVDNDFLEWFQSNHETMGSHETVTLLSANIRKNCHIVCIDCRNAKNRYITNDFLFCYY